MKWLKRDHIPGEAATPDLDRFESMLDELIAAGGPSIVYQPVFLTDSDRMIGVEALSRFPAGLNPGQWFEHAAVVGRAHELETIAARNALVDLEIGWQVIGVNVSAETLSNPAFTRELRPLLGPHVAIELTHPNGPVDAGTLRAQIERARELGVRICVNTVECDPVTQMERLIAIEPEFVKLDPSFTRLLLGSENRRELAERTLLACQQHGAFVIAVGVEQPADLKALRRLGVDAVQGYLLGEPRPIEELTARAS